MNDDFTETIINFIESTTENISELRINVQKALVASVISDTPVDSGTVSYTHLRAHET